MIHVPDLFGYNTDLIMTNDLGKDTLLLRQFVTNYAVELLRDIKTIYSQSPFRYMTIPTGSRMSVSMTSCGEAGWISDRQGYRYSEIDPLTGKCWPAIPVLWRDLACTAAKQAGFNDFQPQSCLINHYQIGTKLSLHRDQDEQQLNAPVVGFSLGIPAVFVWGGLNRQDRQIKLPLFHGDALVFGGCDRLRYHAILPIRANTHPMLKTSRISLTFRQLW